MGKKATLLVGNTIFIIVTILCALFAVLGWLADVITPEQSWFVAMMALGMTPLLIVNFMIGVVWCIKRRWWAVASLVAIVINFDYIMATVQVDMRFKESVPKTDFKVASYNIHGYIHKNFASVVGEVLAYFNNTKTDIVCFQEFFETPQNKIDSVNIYYPYHVIYSQRRDMQLVVFSKYPIVDSKIISFEGSANCAMMANLDVSGRKLSLFNVHLQTTNFNQSQAEITILRDLGIGNPDGKNAFDAVMKRVAGNAISRTQQVDKVKNEIQAHSQNIIMVCGDFNDTPASYAYRQMKHGLSDAFQSAGSGYSYTFNELFKLFRMDYLMHGKELIGVRYGSPKLKFSDHNPVTVELAFDNTVLNN